MDFFKSQLFYLALENIWLHRFELFARFILLLLHDININPGPSTICNNSISLITLPLQNCDESNICLQCDRFQRDFQKGFIYFTFQY